MRVPSAPVQAGLAVVIGAIAWLAWSFFGGDFWPRWVWFGLCTALTAEYLVRRVARIPSSRRRWLAVDAAAVALLAPVELSVWVLSGRGYFWPIWPILAFSTIFGAHAWYLSRRPDPRERQLVERVDTLTRTRQGVLDWQAGELRRIERDLHDGAQARLVSLALNLAMAEDLVRSDPPAAVQLLGEARATARGALDDLRTVMAGIQPSVLADRGLDGGIRALVLDLPVPVSIDGEPPELPEAAEVAVYYAVAECLTNAVKHSRATRCELRFRHDAERFAVEICDDGVGGADPASGTGLRGVSARLEAFDGRLGVDSPPGGPTTITVEIPR